MTDKSFQVKKNDSYVWLCAHLEDIEQVLVFFIWFGFFQIIQIIFYLDICFKLLMCFFKWYSKDSFYFCSSNLLMSIFESSVRVLYLYLFIYQQQIKNLYFLSTLFGCFQSLSNDVLGMCVYVFFLFILLKVSI